MNIAQSISSIPPLSGFRAEAQTRLVLRPQSALAHAAEEQSFIHSQRQERRRSSSGRQTSEARHQAQRQLAVERVKAVLEASRDANLSQQLALTARRIAMQTAAPLQLAREFHPDPFCQYLALEQAADSARQQGGGQRLAQIREAQAVLDEDQALALRSQFHVFAAAQAYSTQDVGQLALREAYRELLQYPPTLSSVVDTLLLRLGDENFGRALSCLIAAAGTDLASGWASQQKYFLHSLLNLLRQAGGVALLLEDSKLLFQELMLPGRDNASLKLTRELVALIASRWISPGQLSAMPAAYGVASLLSRLLFLGRLRDSLRRLPSALFGDEQVQQGIYESVQAAYDQAVAAEDQEQGHAPWDHGNEQQELQNVSA